MACAILSPPHEKSITFIKYIANAIPASLEAKVSDGFTPLLFAFSMCRTSFAKALIECGANLRARNKSGLNLIHLLLHREANYRPHRGPKEELRVTRELLDLIDPEIRKEMFLERSSENPGSLTPLHYWIYRSALNKNSTMMLDLILEYSGGVELGLINGAGETIVHTLINLHKYDVLEALLKHNPELLYVENASGQTALEFAAQKFSIEKIKPRHQPYYRWGGDSRSPANDEPAKFLPDVDNRTGTQKIYDLCVETAKLIPREKKRKLVSLFEANEVAKRLAQQERIKYTNRNKYRYGGGDEGEAENEEDEEEKKINSISWWSRACWCSNDWPIVHDDDEDDN